MVCWLTSSPGQGSASTKELLSVCIAISRANPRPESDLTLQSSLPHNEGNPVISLAVKASSSLSKGISTLSSLNR